MQELLWLAFVIDNYIEIIPQKVCMNNFYSQVAMHQQNKQVSEANKWVCDPLQQEPKKSFKHFPQYDVFISHILRLFSYWPKHFKDGKQKTSCKKKHFLFNQRHEW